MELSKEEFLVITQALADIMDAGAQDECLPGLVSKLTDLGVAEGWVKPAPVQGKRWPEPTVEEPDLDQLEEWLCDGVAEATDGCLVEPDGVCPHGHPSWITKLWF